MIFSAVLTLGTFSISLGAALGAFLCLVIAKIAKKKYQKNRFSLFCLFLSVAVSALTCFIVFVQKNYDINAVFENKADLYFLSALFLTGGVVCAFWKYLLIPFAAVYLLLSFHTISFLNEKFSAFPEKLSITKNSSDSEIFVKIYKIPPKFIVPVDRFYYELEFSDEQSDVSEKKNELQPEKENFIKREIAAFDRWLLKNVEIQKVQFPITKNYPALYLLNFTTHLDSYEIKVSKTL